MRHVSVDTIMHMYYFIAWKLPYIFECARLKKLTKNYGGLNGMNV